MRRLRLFLAGLAVLLVSVAVACAGGSESEAPKSAVVRLPPAAPAGQWVLFGHIRSLARTSGRFEMSFDPAWVLSGVAAERAAVEDKVILPGDPVPNDHYNVEEGHRLLTFVVAPKARVTILVDAGWQTKITVSELAQLLRGKNPRKRNLMGDSRPFGERFGFWIRVGDKYPNPVLSLDQQYQP